MLSLELFTKKPVPLITLENSDQNVNDIVNFEPNSALSVVTNVFLSGYSKKGRVLKIDLDDSKGRYFPWRTMRTGKCTSVINTCCGQICFKLVEDN